MNLVAGSVPSSPPYQAVLFQGSRLVWECDHAHSTRQEAYACASEKAESWDQEDQGELFP